ncbi:MAG: chorismate mutase [Chloroflexi bacterium]|nr:chorismate mutase [Chloroflexota bacterium]MCI0839848.1 chorismate mutase [Chloroflexota bacterium]MCI0884440.1 chorismate mutase [Chloroflexota bacterium]
MLVRGVRGATTIEANTVEAVLEATQELLSAMVEANDIDAEDVASALFTTTPDVNAEFPAVAAREMGWEHVALLCGHEMSVPKALKMCLRILIHVNTDKPAKEIRHIYLRGATALRPDIGKQND